MNIIWRVKGDEGLRYDDWYLVESNHQTWVDFLVVQKVLNRKVPPLKFFAKRQLLWLPFVGLAAWAFDCPFMKRYSKKFIEKHPHLKGKDLEITRKACQKFKEMPTAIMIFIEGTRLTRAKHETQNSPYRFLLKPKSGGIGFVLSSMNGQLNKMLNVTIAYPEGGMSFWEFLCGKVHEVRVDIEIIPLSEIPVWDSMTDDSSRKAFQEWLNNLWKKKDLKITEMLA